MKSSNVVFVHGLMGWGPNDLGGLPYWGDAPAQFTPRFLTHLAKCGPLSSVHDCACELFAQIVGARIDYGESHSAGAGHARFSRDYTGRGFVASWSAENPVILIGHSAGAQTCRMLQNLLAQDFWGLGSNADWVEAIVSIAGPLNGSTLAYRYCDEEQGKPKMLPSALVASALSVVSALSRVGASRLYDLHLDHWAREEESGEFFSQRLDASRFIESGDNLGFDVTLHGAARLNQSMETFEACLYLSLVSSATREGSFMSLPFLRKRHRPDRSMDLTMRDSASYIATRPEFSVAPTPDWGRDDLTMELWRENDGVVNTISQRYPFIGRVQPVGGEGIFGFEERLETGKWRYQRLDQIFGRAFDHNDATHGARMKPFEAGRREIQRELYRKLARLFETFAEETAGPASRAGPSLGLEDRAISRRSEK
jgi:triacylglycerol lipase